MNWPTFYFRMVKIGVLLLFLQNFALTFIIYFGDYLTSKGGTSIFDNSLVGIVIFSVDILGFFMIGIALSLLSYSIEEKQNAYELSGLFVLLWVLFRIVWQYMLGTNVLQYFLTQNFYTNHSESIYQIFSVAYIAGGLSLFFSSFFLIRIRPTAIVYTIYTGVNAIGTFLIAAPFVRGVAVSDENLITPSSGFFYGLVIKVLIVPVLGVVAFTFLWAGIDKMKIHLEFSAQLSVHE